MKNTFVICCVMSGFENSTRSTIKVPKCQIASVKELKETFEECGTLKGVNLQCRNVCLLPQAFGSITGLTWL